MREVMAFGFPFSSRYCFFIEDSSIGDLVTNSLSKFLITESFEHCEVVQETNDLSNK